MKGIFPTKVPQNILKHSKVRLLCSLHNILSSIIKLCAFDATGSVMETLAEDEPVRGVTSLEDRLYLLRGSVSSNQIEVYDVCDSYSLLHYLNVPGLGFAFDIVVSAHFRCAYVSDTSNQCVHCVPLPGCEVTWWPVNDVPSCLSLTVRNTVLVTCRKVDMIKEFSTYGVLCREIRLGVASPWHAVQLCSGNYVVCQGDKARRTSHCVCLMDSNGDGLSYQGVGADGQAMNTPCHMAVDGNEFVFVVDRNNAQVLLLSPTMTYLREVVSQEELGLGWKPYRLSVDVERRLLYVAVNEQNNPGDYTAGRVAVVRLDLSLIHI